MSVKENRQKSLFTSLCALWWKFAAPRAKKKHSLFGFRAPRICFTGILAAEIAGEPQIGHSPPDANRLKKTQSVVFRTISHVLLAVVFFSAKVAVCVCVFFFNCCCYQRHQLPESRESYVWTLWSSASIWAARFASWSSALRSIRETIRGPHFIRSNVSVCDVL